jgi:DNA-directed RNA polymerase specialized sigma24 family protein
MADTLQLGLSATKMRLYRALKQLGECLPRDIETYA